MKGIVKIFCGNNHQSNMIYRFLSKVKQKRKKHLTAFEQHVRYILRGATSKKWSQLLFTLLPGSPNVHNDDI